MRISAPSSSVHSTRSGIEHDDVADGLDVAGGDRARSLLLHHHALGAFALHLDGDVLDVEHDVGHVLAHARRSTRTRAARRRYAPTAPPRPAARTAECAAAHCPASRRSRARAARRPRSLRAWVVAGGHLQLVRSDQFLPVLLDRHVGTHRVERRGSRPRIPLRPVGMIGGGGRVGVRRMRISSVIRGASCAAGSRCAGSASRRGSK